MNTWWGRSVVCLSADRFAENLLESSGADVKRSRLEGRNGILMWIWTMEYLVHLWLHVQMKGCRQRRHTERPPAPPPEEHVPEMRGQGVHAKALRIRAFWSEIGSTPGCPACVTPGPGKSHTRACRSPGTSSRTAPAEEAKLDRCRSRHTTTGPEWKFDGSRAEEDKNDLCDRQREPDRPYG